MENTKLLVATFCEMESVRVEFPIQRKMSYWILSGYGRQLSESSEGAPNGDVSGPQPFHIK